MTLNFEQTVNLKVVRDNIADKVYDIVCNVTKSRKKEVIKSKLIIRISTLIISCLCFFLLYSFLSKFDSFEPTNLSNIFWGFLISLCGGVYLNPVLFYDLCDYTDNLMEWKNATVIENRLSNIDFDNYSIETSFIILYEYTEIMNCFDSDLINLKNKIRHIIAYNDIKKMDIHNLNIKNKELINLEYIDRNNCIQQYNINNPIPIIESISQKEKTLQLTDSELKLIIPC